VVIISSPIRRNKNVPYWWKKDLAVFVTIMMEYNVLIIDEVLYLYVGANTPK